MSKYSDQLLDPRWQKKRLEILHRDNWTCRKCGDRTKQLHAHHLYYVSGRAPWEYHSRSLLTLCSDCHSKRWGEKVCDWEFISLSFLSRGERFSVEFAGEMFDFCEQTGVTEQQIIDAFRWLFKKPGTLLPLIDETEMKP